MFQASEKQTKKKTIFYKTFIISNTMTFGKLVIKCPRKPEGLLQILPKLEGTFNTFPMVLLCNTMIEEEI